MNNTKSAIPVFTTGDNNYAPFIATTIASVCDNTNSFINFYILDGGISEENKEIIKNLNNKFKNFTVEFLKIDTEKIFDGFVLPDNLKIAVSTYNRLLIPNMKPNLGKVVYLDSDIIVLDDIKKLYNQDLKGKLLAAVPDQIPSHYMKKVKEGLGLKEDSVYFNAGVMLLDCAGCRAKKAVETFFEIETKMRDKLFMCDQDILNLYFENNYTILERKFNVLYKNSDIAIRHYIGNIKPWHINPETKCEYISNLNEFWKYAQMTPYYQELKSKTENQDLQNDIYRKLRFMSIMQNLSIVK